MLLQQQKQVGWKGRKGEERERGAKGKEKK